MRDDFSAICGITERELPEELRPDIGQMALANGEVRKGFIESLLPAYIELPGQSNTSYVVLFLRDLRKGDIDSCLERNARSSPPFPTLWRTRRRSITRPSSICCFA